jgi:L-threonylcarbamoyladenylate synthase
MHKYSPTVLQEAKNILFKNAGLVGFPTETVYGLAANAFNPLACEMIFKVKGRPLTDPLIVHVNNIN